MKKLIEINTWKLSKSQWDQKMAELMNDPKYRLINVTAHGSTFLTIIHYAWFEYTSNE